MTPSNPATTCSPPATHRRKALSLAELLTAAALSTLVMAGTMALIPAYEQADSQVTIQQLQLDAEVLYSRIQSWMQSAATLIGVTPAPWTALPPPDPSGDVMVFVWVGDRDINNNTAQAHEIECLRLQTTWDVDDPVAAPGTYSSTLTRYYYPDDGGSPVTIDLTDLNYGYLSTPANWLASATTEVWSNNTVGVFSVQQHSDTTINYLTAGVTLLDFTKVFTQSGSAVIPEAYSFEVVGSPDEYEAPK